jgi:pyruvate dehydrogenase E2 component (dihydrolipoamide acetyltransferase)
VPPVAAPVAPTTAGGRRAVPRARRRAAELGLDLSRIPGTGPDGAVTADDVERAAGGPTTAPTTAPVTAPAPAAAPSTASSAARLAAMQAAVGALMARSKREVPHYYLSTTIDLAAAVDWLAAQNAERSVADRLVPAALLLKATALAARRVPEVNGFWTESGFAPSEGVHLGVAISLRGGGLMAPAISDADKAGLDELMKALRDLVTRTRAGRLRQSEMAAPTLTVTNLGDLGVEEVYGVIYPPQVALVGFGRIADRPVAVDRMLAVRPVVTATLCGDHRVSDGHRGGRFLSTIETLLQHPEEL